MNCNFGLNVHYGWLKMKPDANTYTIPWSIEAIQGDNVGHCLVGDALGEEFERLSRQRMSSAPTTLGRACRRAESWKQIESDSRPQLYDIISNINAKGNCRPSLYFWKFLSLEAMVKESWINLGMECSFPLCTENVQRSVGKVWAPLL